jgi:16S rRNA (adenine1518-N6/adenine1519-N6)-dimethyltransferase
LIVNADILERKNVINPKVIETLERMLARGATDRLKLVSNLPYVVATPVITNFLLTELPFERMVVTIQWELAERLIATPSTKDFGALTVLVQSLADVEIIRRLPPSAFWPRPKVDSGLVLILPNAEKRSRIGDLARFHAFVRDLYLHRRKNLRGALLPTHGQRFSRGQLDEVLRRHGFDPSGRAEALSVEDHLRLCEALK